MSEKYSATELVDVVVAIADTADVADTVFADGVVSARDIASLPSLLRALKEFGDVDYTQLLPEAIDLSVDEAKLVAAAFNEHFNIQNDTIEDTIESGIALLLEGVDKIKGLWDYVQKVRGKLPVLTAKPTPAPAPVKKGKQA